MDLKVGPCPPREWPLGPIFWTATSETEWLPALFTRRNEKVYHKEHSAAEPRCAICAPAVKMTVPKALWTATAKLPPLLR